MSTYPPEPPPGEDPPPAAPGSSPPPPPAAPSAPSAPSAPPAAPPAAPPSAPSAPGGYDAPSAPGGYDAPGTGYGYGAPAHSGQATGHPGSAVGGGYADWPKRALSGLIDFVAPALVAALVYQVSTTLGILFNFAALAWALYNAYLGGQTGQSYGKKIAGTRLVLEATGAPPGGGLGIGRYFVHFIDALPCYLGFLWPLWDSKRQTFADKILKTVVVTV